LDIIGNRMKKTLIILVLLTMVLSCRKVKDCFSSAGEEILNEFELPEFDTLVIKDDFIVNLVQDSINYIQVSGYESFVNATEFVVEQNSLIVQNNHKCKFSKPKSNHTKLFIHINEISRIKLNSSSKFISQNELTNDDEIGLIINSKYNEVDLKLNCNTFYYWNTHLNGGKITLEGDINILKLWNTSLGSVNAQNLITSGVLIDTDSKADITVNVSEKIDCTVRGHGNVYCYGNPVIIIKNDSTSTGRLIFVE